jgi:hypothetical protein
MGKKIFIILSFKKYVSLEAKFDEIYLRSQ